MADTVADAVGMVRERVAAAARRAGRDPTGVRVVAATKGVDPERIAEAVRAGVGDLGENRARDLRDKAVALGGDRVRWHHLGAIQTRQVRYLDAAWLVQGLDRLREAEALDARGERLDRTWQVLVEVNLGRERQKQGIAPEQVEAFLEGLEAYRRVQVRGFMFMAPQVENPEDVRWMFAEGRRLADRTGLGELSMGMTDDYEVAVEEGATIVRVGRAIFGRTEGR